MKFESPLFILGAGRSGTNFLSKVLEKDPGFYNSFENRYIWNYRQRGLGCDIRTSDEATSDVCDFIRGYFRRAAQENKACVIDKTPSNCLRLGFVHEVFPDAKFIHIIRDGRDNLVSRELEWFGGKNASAVRSSSGGLNYRLTYVKHRTRHLFDLVKRGNIPVSRFPAFLYDNVSPFLVSLVSGSPRRYGERFVGMSDCLAKYGLRVTACIQWRECVMFACSHGRRLPENRYKEIKYEDLLRSPEQTFLEICEFLDRPIADECKDWLLANVKLGNFDKWRDRIDASELLAIEPHIRPTLEYLGYRWD